MLLLSYLLLDLAIPASCYSFKKPHLRLMTFRIALQIGDSLPLLTQPCSVPSQEVFPWPFLSELWPLLTPQISACPVYCFYFLLIYIIILNYITYLLMVFALLECKLCEGKDSLCLAYCCVPAALMRACTHPHTHTHTALEQC